MTTTKLIALPSKPNRLLLGLLRRLYIDESFQHLSNSIAMALNNSLAVNNPEFSQVVLKMINAIILDNIYRYVHENESLHFATALGYGQFALNCRVRVKYMTHLFSMWGILSEDQRDEVETHITHVLMAWFIEAHRQYQSEMDATFMEIYESMTLYTPHRFVKTYQFEIGPDLSPLFIYTDCIHEIASFH